MEQAFTSFFRSTLPVAIFGCLIPLTAEAQISADGTTSTTVNQNGNDFTIDQGDRINDNLFHSFNEFSVPTLGSAAFNNASDIANIFSRVTGSNISSIDGLLSANGAANLFLINPNGIIFGENASLNLGGSFFASTADSLLFEGDTEFSASNPQAPPLLEVSIPIGAKFRDNPGDIVNRSISTPDTAFFVPSGKTLALIGGDVTLESGQVFALGGTVELGGLAAAGTIKLNDDFSPSFPDGVTRADVFLNNGALIISSGGGGNITINARNLQLAQSVLFAGITPDEGNPEARAGDITINATDNITVNSSLISNQVGSEALGNAGDVSITTGSLSLTNEGVVNAITFGQGNAGSVQINATDNITVNSSLISNQVGSEALGNAGDVSITTGSLSLTNEGIVNARTFGKGDGGDIGIATNNLSVIDGSQIIADTSGQGNAGSIFINATDSIIIDGENSDGNLTVIGSGVDIGALGDAGDIEIATGNLTLTNGGQILVSTLGQGNAGSISIDANESTILDNGFITNVIEQGALGNGGNIDITTSDLSLINNGGISAGTFGKGDGGNIEIVTDNLFLTKVGQINARTFGRGNGGNIEIVTTNLSINDGGQISTETSAEGNSGSIFINAANEVILDGMSADGFANGILNKATDNAEGNSGNLEIATANLFLSNGSEISVSTLGQGNAGSISIDSNELTILENSFITNGTEQFTIGNSGNIDISTTNLSLINNGGIFAGNLGKESSIIINAVDEVTLDDGFIAKGGEGNAGKIEITTSNLSLTNGSQILSSISGQGKGSSININASDTVKLEGFSAGGLNSPFSSTFGSILSQNELFFNEEQGDAGDINITTSNLVLINGGGIGTVTFGDGNAGSISINAADTVTLTEGFIYNDVSSNANAKGNGGDIDIITTNLSLNNNNSYILADTLSQGDAGSISINAADAVILEGEDTGIFNFTFNFTEDFTGILSDEAGDGGNIEITTANLLVTNGSQIAAQTYDEGQAGTLAINASESVKVNGLNSGLFSRTGGGADAGNVIITTPKLAVQNNAQVGVNNFIETELRIDRENGGIEQIFNPSEGSGNAGRSEIIADLVELEDGGSLVAISAAGDGGNINLQASDLLLLRRGGNISTTAGLQSTSGSGGNISIDSTLILAFPNENSDITANAFNGIGGNIEIFTEGIFGLEERRSIATNTTNDIDASSELGLQGDIAINNPDIDRTSGLIELPQVVGDASDQISQNPCEQGVGSEFTISGKGGLPSKPNDILGNNEVEVDLVELTPVNQENHLEVNGDKPDSMSSLGINTLTSEVKPARGWEFNDKGEITLTAYSKNDREIKASEQQYQSNCSSGI